MFCFVLFCFVLYKRDRQPARMATWPMSQAPGARSRPSPRTHRAAIRPPVRGYSQFEFRRLLPARTAQSAPFRWPTVGHVRSRLSPGPRRDARVPLARCPYLHVGTPPQWPDHRLRLWECTPYYARLLEAPPGSPIGRFATRRDRDPPTRTLTGPPREPKKAPRALVRFRVRFGPPA